MASGKTLPTSSLSLATAAVASPGTTSPDPTMTAGAYTLDAGSAVKIASAAVDTGMGQYDISFAAGNDLTLSVPATAFARTYRSDLTVTLASTP
ncbi:MAG: WxL domain-containing protein [Acidimicrobiales bacterium]